MAKSMFLTKQKAQRIHEASVRILIPGTMVEEALRKAGSRIQMYNRDGKKTIVIRNGRTYFGPGSDALYNIDRQTGGLRFSTLADVRENVKLADALTEFDFMMSMALPIITTATDFQDIERIHHIASVTAGGEDKLKEKPFFIAYLEPNSPLIVDRSNTSSVDIGRCYKLPTWGTGGCSDVARGRDYRSFFEHPHTAENFRHSLWLPPRFIRRKLIEHSGNGSDLTEKLSEEINSILESHTPAPFDEKRNRAIEEYLASI